MQSDSGYFVLPDSLSFIRENLTRLASSNPGADKRFFSFIFKPNILIVAKNKLRMPAKVLFG